MPSTSNTTIIFAALGQSYVLLLLAEQVGPAAAAVAPSSCLGVGILPLAGSGE